MNYEELEAITFDNPHDGRVPYLAPAPSDPEAAAPGDPFMHAIRRRGESEPLVRFWCPDARYDEELRVDLEVLADSFDGTPPTFRAAATLISVVFFYYHTNGFFKDQGVERLHMRDVRSGERLVGPHP